MRKTFVSSIKDRDQVDEVFLVKEKITAMAKNGKPYLTLRLMDKSGEVDAKVWDNADQVAAPIDVAMTGEAPSVEVTLKESDLAKLKNFVVNGSYTTGTDTGLPAGAQAYEEISFGGILSIPKTSVAVISPRRDATGKFVVSQLYSAYQAEAIQLPFQRGKETTYKVKFEGLADGSRAAGDQVGKLYRQT